MTRIRPFDIPALSIAIIGGERVNSIGSWYVPAPALLGAVVLLVIALLVNNLSRDWRFLEQGF